MNPRRVIATDNCSVRPVRSASSRVAILPAWATTPTPSADTDKPADHAVLFTYGVPSTREPQTIDKSKFPLQDRHFRTFKPPTRRSAVNDPG